ncbi:uncharacterized protein LOC111698220 isoform X2 [Eurytemora carolleeae]|uniref:uncharacterized protein LOC111698220 isoform X2 n=1 Tax=Eurytemora carolleeae TaxID=1294199 RepID=UPI000C776BE6|nr:uncharacterized protein LOC111698220 isoform X2 [Eurytemora carolleeae]|eukprot:XP_023324271.1 uncharacterized protein LOC111698220 isoform X2 [Eurytemora affinis]
MDPLVKLPPEILEKILSFLDSRDLCSFVLVNKRCLEIGSRPYLWKNTRISKRMVIRRGIPNLLIIDRYAKLPALDLSNLWYHEKEWNVLFLDVLSSPKLDSLDISSPQSFSKLDPELCSESLSTIRNLNISNAKLPPPLFNKLLKKILNKQITKEINISKTDLTEVPMELFTDIVTSLDTIDLRQSNLTPRQLRFLVEHDGKMAKITLRVDGGDVFDGLGVCNDVPILHIFQGLFDRLYKLELNLLDFSGVGTEYWSAVFRSMPDSLESLTLGGMGLDLADVPVDIVSNALSRRKELDLSGIVLSPSHWDQFFLKMNVGRLIDLKLKMINISDLKAETISSAFSNLRSLSLNYVCLSTDQWNHLFINSFPSIHHLTVNNVNLSNIQDTSWESTVRRVETLNLAFTNLTDSQSSRILSSALLNSTLRTLNLAGNILRDVPADLLANTATGIHTVNLAAAKLVDKQVVALLSRVLGSCKLRDLNVEGCNLAQVPSTILALALSRLRSVNLGNCFLSREQLKELSGQIEHNYTTLEYISVSRMTMVSCQMTGSEINTLSSNLYFDIKH